jgi:hypothetical protein
MRRFQHWRVAVDSGANVERRDGEWHIVRATDVVDGDDRLIS